MAILTTDTEVSLRSSSLKAWAGIEPASNGFADRRVNQLRHHAILDPLPQFKEFFERD